MSTSGVYSPSNVLLENKRIEEEISAQEREIYDRQIRLWGMEAQNKLRNSTALLVGLTGLGAEVAKNLMLAGLRSITLMDDRIATPEDKMANFLLPDENFVGMNLAEGSADRAKELNPMVELNTITDGLKQRGKETWSKFDIVILIDQPFEEARRVDAECRELKVRFAAGSVFGGAGFAFFDFNNHDFLFKIKAPQFGTGDIDAPIVDNMTTIEDDRFEKQKVSYPSLQDFFSVDWTGKKYIRKVVRYLPQVYYPIKACLHGSDQGGFADTQSLREAWKAEVERNGQDCARFTYEEEDFEYFLGPQMSPVCAIVGGVIGQEAIKALSENELPLKNSFFYSAFDTVGVVCNLPPP
ncbi:unnamed protein product, partial [Mesorhabditis belari]|uniref:THIF-type NAD/FAD binding fold domain-containing protein n=1 Tax=Mesorhabditis belari TaxID=2138241 RepID=A0AAF3EWJ1_9BILA